MLEVVTYESITNFEINLEPIWPCGSVYVRECEGQNGRREKVIRMTRDPSQLYEPRIQHGLPRPDQLWGPPSLLFSGYRCMAAGSWSWSLTSA